LRSREDGHTLPRVASRLRVLSEAEAYARCYSGAAEDVRVVKIPRRPRYQLEVSGEDLRAAFAERLDKREPELDPDAHEEEGAAPEADADAPPAAAEEAA
jgi:hypothetical protein